MWEAWDSAPLGLLPPFPPQLEMRGVWSAGARKWQRKTPGLTDGLLSDPELPRGPPALAPAPGGRERKPAAGESHLSGFLESGHTRNSSSAGSKARGGFPVLSLLSADRRDPDA